MASPTMNENAPAKLVPIHLSSRSPPQTFVLCPVREGGQTRRRKPVRCTAGFKRSDVSLQAKSKHKPRHYFSLLFLLNVEAP
jgi:hypothetical protein